MANPNDPLFPGIENYWGSYGQGWPSGGGIGAPPSGPSPPLPFIGTPNQTAPGWASPSRPQGGGNSTNYMNLLTGDPWYMAQNSLLSAQGIADAAQRAQAVGQALIRFGEVPDLGSILGAGNGITPPKPTYTGPDNPYRVGGAAGNAYEKQFEEYKRALQQWEKLYGPKAPVSPWQSDVTDLVRQAAQQNTTAGLSQVARMAASNEDARRNIVNQLTARGILSSGETGFQLGRQSLGYQQQQYDARQELLDFLQQAYAQSSNNELARRSAQLAALQEAYGRNASRFPAGFTPDLSRI